MRKHFQLTAQLIVDALSDGDAEAVKALAEAFLAWPQRSSYQLGAWSNVRRSVPFVMTAAALDEPWIAIKKAVETDGIKLTKEKIEDLCGELLLRYWFDLRLVLILLMIRSASPDNQTDPAIEAALALLHGPSEDWHGIDARHGFYQPERILLRLVRLSYARFAYKKRLDDTCKYALGWTSSPDEGYPDLSHGYTNLSALKRPLLILLYSLAPKSRFDPQYLDRRLDGPKSVLDQQLYGSSGDPRFLKDAWERALRDSGPALQRDCAMVRRIRKALERPEKNPKAKRWVEDVLEWMEKFPERLIWANLEIVKDADGFDEN